MTTFCRVLLWALLFTASLATAQTQPYSLLERRPTYHAVGIDVVPTAVLREPRLSYEYRKHYWGLRGAVGYRFPSYHAPSINIGGLIDYDLFHARRGQYFGLGLHHYFPHRMKQDYIVNLLLGLQLGYHRYRLDNRCLYDGVDSEAESYRILDRQTLVRKSARVVVGLSATTSLVKKVSILMEVYFSAGPGLDTFFEKGTRVYNSRSQYSNSCEQSLDGATTEPINDRYYQAAVPAELGLRISYLIKKRMY